MMRTPTDGKPVPDKLQIYLIVLLFSPVECFWMNFKEIKCSSQCYCLEEVLETTVNNYYENHTSLIAEEHRFDLEQFNLSADYLYFLGYIAPFFFTIKHVVCELSDGQPHSIKALIHGFLPTMFTALEITCKRNEFIIFDIPPDETSFNIFKSEKCRLIKNYEKKYLVFPINLWILQIELNDRFFMDAFNFKHMHNTISVLIKGSNYKGVPYFYEKGQPMPGPFVMFLEYLSLTSYKCLGLSKRTTVLNLKGNLFTVFPECILDSAYISLNYLSLAHNKICDLTPLYDSSRTSSSPDIYLIDLSFNDLTKLMQFRDLGRLSVLDLSNNKIKQLSIGTFLNLKNLKKLIINNNRLFNLDWRKFPFNSKAHIYSFNLMNKKYTGNVSKVTGSIALNIAHNKLKNAQVKHCQMADSQEGSLDLYSGLNPYIECVDCSYVNLWILETEQMFLKKNLAVILLIFSIFFTYVVLFLHFILQMVRLTIKH